jgi:hypothetical protein
MCQIESVTEELLAMAQDMAANKTFMVPVFLRQPSNVVNRLLS